MVVIAGWSLYQTEKPKAYWVTTRDLGRHLGYSQPITMIEVIYTCFQDCFVKGVDTEQIIEKVPYSGPQGIRVFSLRGALKAVLYSRSSKTDKVIDELVNVFITLYKNGKLPSPVVGQETDFVTDEVQTPVTKVVPKPEPDKAEEKLYAKFLLAWDECFHGRPTTIKKIKTYLSSDQLEDNVKLGDLRQIIITINPSNALNFRELGYYLRKNKGREVNGYQLEIDRRGNEGTWWVVKVIPNPAIAVLNGPTKCCGCP